jgi:uncharacterized protein DUF3618
MTSPEQIHEEIDHTRASLSRDVDRLGDKVLPGKIVGRRVDRVKNSAASMRARIMGSSNENGRTNGTRAPMTSAASSTRDAVSSAASSVGDAAANAPQAVRRQTQGNPLAAGLIAFGVGWLLSSLAPPSGPEAHLAHRVEETAGDLAQPLKEHAQEVAAEMQQPLQESADEIKSAATDAARQTADHAKSAAADVREPFQQ